MDKRSGEMSLSEAGSGIVESEAKLKPMLLISFVSSDRSSYSDSVLLYIVYPASHFLRFSAFLPIYIVVSIYAFTYSL